MEVIIKIQLIPLIVSFMKRGLGQFPTVNLLVPVASFTEWKWSWWGVVLVVSCPRDRRPGGQWLGFTFYPVGSCPRTYALTPGTRWPCWRLWHYPSPLPARSTHPGNVMAMLADMALPPVSSLHVVLTPGTWWPCWWLWHYPSPLPARSTHPGNVMAMLAAMALPPVSSLRVVRTPGTWWPCWRLWHYPSPLPARKTHPGNVMAMLAAMALPPVPSLHVYTHPGNVMAMLAAMALPQSPPCTYSTHPGNHVGGYGTIPSLHVVLTQGTWWPCWRLCNYPSPLPAHSTPENPDASSACERLFRLLCHQTLCAFRKKDGIHCLS